MAKREHPKRHPFLLSLFLLLPLLLLLSFFFHLPRSSISTSLLSSSSRPQWNPSCNYSDGFWVPTPPDAPLPYGPTCREIFKGWNCLAAGKANALALAHFRWQPRGCDLPRFDPTHFLSRFRNANIGFVGDSLNRNMFVSMVCALRRAAGAVRKWRPAGADRGFTFLNYNLTVAYHRTNLLVQYGRWAASSSYGPLESLGYKNGYKVDVDVPASTWVNAPMFHDILIFNTGHWWWAPSKFDPVESPMLFFENGKPVLPPMLPEDGLDLALKHMIKYVEKEAKHDSIKYFRTQSPRHFEGGDWNEGGTCRHIQPLLPEKVEDLFSLTNNRTNSEARQVNKHLFKALKGSSFQILDITHMSEFRADAHPSTTGGKKHEDCMHWCLPGTTDSWNDLLVLNLESAKNVKT